ncbi:MAG TPA: transcriptional regulator [Methanocorpusculum sp.]|nr:transcriptional regulator [Methanocorpusculum sp.]
MSSTKLIQNVISILIMAGYNVSKRCEMRPRSFDILASNGKQLLVIKIVSQIDSINGSIALDLDKITRHLNATPLIIGERARNTPLKRGVIYIRYGINAVSPSTLYDYVIGEELPLIYVSAGGLYVDIDFNKLRILRENRSLSIGNLANLLGVSRRAVSRYESGMMGTTLDIALKLEEIFDDTIVNPIDLFKYTPLPEEVKPASLSFGSDNNDISPQHPVNRLRSIGVNIQELQSAPFDAFARFEDEIILLSCSNPHKETITNAELVGDISKISNTHSLCVVHGYKKEKMVGNTLMIGSDKLMDVSDGLDLLDILNLN